MDNQLSWLVNDDKAYLIEFLETTPGGATVSINGSEANYLAVITDTGESIQIPCGHVDCRLIIGPGRAVSLLADGVEKLPLPADLADKLKPKHSKKNVNPGLVVAVVVLSLLNALNVNRHNHNNYALQAGIAVSLIILAAYVLLFIVTYHFEFLRWLSFGMIAADILILAMTFFNGLDFLFLLGTPMMDIRSQLTLLADRVIYLLVLYLYCRLAFRLFKLAQRK